MKIFYITSLDLKKTGGLFNATAERILRHKNKYSIEIVNNNTFHSKFIKVLFKIFKGRTMNFGKQKDQVEYKKLKINNINIKLSLFYYLKRFIINQPIRLMSNQYIKKYNHCLKESNIIHAHWGWPHGYIALLISEKYSLPYFITFHGSDIKNLDLNHQDKMLNSMEKASKCFFVSKSLLNAAIEKGYSGKNAIINYNGVDADKFRLRKSVNKKTKTVAFMGALKSIKGVDLLPEIFREIYQRNSSIHFKIIGDGVLKNDLQSAFINSEFCNQVTFTGNIAPDQVPDVLESVDALVVPSRMEGLGMVILEANAMGIPVIGSDVGGIPEAIGSKEHIVKFDENFIRNCAIRLIDVVNDVNYNQKALEMRERVKKCFSWENTVRIEDKYYESVIKK